MFSHPKLKLILSVYVDDFKLAGVRENIKKGWDLMTQAGLELDLLRHSVTTSAAVSIHTK